MNSLVEENYLKALLHLANQDGFVNVNDLSKHLKIKMPTVTSMMKKLALKELVHYESYKPLRLTASGKKEAASIVRKHRLTEMFLVEKMGFGWEEVHEIAEQIEHIQSPLFFEKMDQILGFPKFDPHGSPIPDKNGKIELRKYLKLSECQTNEKLVIRAVNHQSNDFLKYLNARDLTLGTIISILSIEDFDKTMVIQYNDHLAETISLTVSERLLVEKIKK